ncbi:hypothetical protein MANI_028141 [Metarhizium anisopliae]|nr:hypothetical protein MANI_028141 [Metarhizium anisopliae]
MRRYDIGAPLYAVDSARLAGGVEENGPPRVVSPSHTCTSRPIVPQLPHHVHFYMLPFLELNDKSTLSQADLALLAANGCLSIPDKSLTDDFLRQYFLYVHPSTIVVDESEFWRAYENSQKDHACKIPLLLFQAILFASAPYVDVSTLQKCGFNDRRHALCTLYHRTKLLFEIKTEDRPRYLSSAAVLLTFYTPPTNAHAANSWLDRAIQLGKLAETHPKTCKESVKQPNAQPTWKKRLWWSILIRDRSLCLGLRRKPLMTSKELKFVSSPIEDEELMREICESRVYDRPTKHVLAGIFREQCQLGLLLTAMVSLGAAPNKTSCSSASQDEIDAIFSTISLTKKALADWMAFSRLPARLAEDPPVPVRRNIKITLMYYHAACIDIAHYESMLLEGYCNFDRPMYHERFRNVGNMLHNSMAELIQIMEGFSQEEQHHGFPISLLAFVEMPLIIAAIDLKLSPSTLEMETRRRRWQALGRLHSACGRAYDVADVMSSCTNQLLRLAYDFTRQIFLGNSHGPDDAVVRRNDRRPRSSRAQNWGDAFVLFPRAYLMISASVDYYLCEGALPSSSCLPEFVQSSLPLGVAVVFEIDLPWSPNDSDQDPSRARLQEGMPAQNYAPLLVRGTTVYARQLGQMSDYQVGPRSDTTVLSTVECTVRNHNETGINLNYFDMTAMSETTRPQTQNQKLDDSQNQIFSGTLNGLATPGYETELWPFFQLITP